MPVLDWTACELGGTKLLSTLLAGGGALLGSELSEAGGGTAVLLARGADFEVTGTSGINCDDAGVEDCAEGMLEGCACSEWLELLGASALDTGAPLELVEAVGT